MRSLQVILVVLETFNVLGSRLPSCISGKLTVNESLPSNTITCDQLGTTQPSTWSLTTPTIVNLGVCFPNNNTCQSDFPGRFDLSRSGANSTVTIAQSEYSAINSSSITCSTDSEPPPAVCALDVVYPPDVSKCTVKFTSGTWTLEISCNVTKTYSSRGSYWCTGYRRHQSSQTDLVGNQTYSPTAISQSSPYKTGTCSFSASKLGWGTTLPSDNQFYFRVDVYPGPTPVESGPLSLERPVAPTAGCPVMVGENTPFTCTCTTTKIGQPPGRLQWSGGTTGTVNVNGSYGDSSLTSPPQTLTRQDNGTTRLTCEVQWAEGSYRNVYTANVGFPASKTDLKVNSANVSENDSVTLTCSVTGGNPPINSMALTGPPSLSFAGTSLPLTHTLGPATCNMTGQYTCSVDNGYGTTTGTTSLTVHCRPRGVAILDPLNFENRTVERQFEVTTYPSPTQVTFLYLGLANSTVTSDVNPHFITISGSCVQSPTVMYQSTCTVTVYNMTTDLAAGYYRVTVRNTQGEGNFTLQVLFNAAAVGPPSPSSAIGAIIGGAVGGTLAAVAVAVVCVVIFMWWRKSKRNSHKHTALPKDQTTNKHVPCSPAKLDMHPLRDVNPGGSAPTKKVKTKGQKPSKPVHRKPQPENIYNNVDDKTDPVGLHYVDVEFPTATTSSGPPVKPKPKEPETIYSDIDLSKTAHK